MLNNLKNPSQVHRDDHSKIYKFQNLSSFQDLRRPSGVRPYESSEGSYFGIMSPSEGCTGYVSSLICALICEYWVPL